MGVTLYIGNKVVGASEDDYPVEVVTLPEAPAACGDDLTGHSNRRQMSYGAFADFCAETGLTTILYQHVRENHPGALPITNNLVNEVGLALRAYEERHRLLPSGFWPLHDPDKARLHWLYWWMNWALKHCQQPVVANR